MLELLFRLFHEGPTFGGRDHMSMFDELMNDIVTIQTGNGEVYTNIRASVQGKKIFTERTDIPISPGDRVIRRTNAGVEEVFIIEDPGFQKGLGPIGDAYQMTVHRAGASKPHAGTVIYNVTGPNARFNNNSIDASTNVINQTHKELFEALRKVIENQIHSQVEKARLLSGAEALKREVGTSGFTTRYAEFMSLAANHMQVLAPFIPALSQLLK